MDGRRGSGPGAADPGGGMTISQIATAQDGVCYVLVWTDYGGGPEGRLGSVDLREDGQYVGSLGFASMAAARRAAEERNIARVTRDGTDPLSRFSLTWRTEVI